MKKCIALCATSVLLAMLFAPAALAADINITADGSYTITPTDTSVTIAAGLTVTLIGSSAATYAFPIVCGEGVALTLQNVRIIAGAVCPLSFTGSGNQLILTGDNLLQSYAAPGVRVENTTSLTISGSGTLTARGGSGGGAGIGGGSNTACGTVTISGGTILALGGQDAAAIGGGANGAGGAVNITDGTVFVIGGPNAAGIGGGSGVGVGGGDITISGGTVTANSSLNGAAIGIGLNGSGGSVTITDGTVTATAGDYGAGIGGGRAGTNGTVTISGGTVTATGGAGAAGIGGGQDGGSGSVIISGGAVTATGGDLSAGIGGGRHGTNGSVAISGGEITAAGGGLGAGIGSGYISDSGTIEIYGGMIIATGGSAAAGIGGGASAGGLGGSGGTIAISGGVVYAEGDTANAALDIGSGAGASTGALAISGTAAVFLCNDTCLPPTLPVPHEHKTTADLDAPMQVEDGTIYGLPGTGVGPWTSALGGYFVLWRIVYDANGGAGSVPDTVRHITATAATVRQSAGISQSGYEFTAWNTAANGSGTVYPAGSALALTSPRITLYAQWTPIPQTGDAAGSPYLLAALMGFSAAGIGAALRIKAKKRTR